MARLRLLLPGTALLLTAIGVAYIHSASWNPHTGQYGQFGTRQAVFTAVALVGCLVATFYPYQKIRRRTHAIFALSIVLLLGLPFAGELLNGARSWYRLPGGLKLQPAELVKIALILAMAHHLARLRAPSFKGACLLALVPFVLVSLQPDLGTAMTFVPVVAAMVFCAGVRLRSLFGLAGVGLVAGPLAYFGGFLKAHQVRRIEFFLDPDLDPLGAGFQAIQSRIAIGAGGLFGQGYGQGSQTQLHYLPDSHTDFIFAVIAEEGGFIVAGFVLVAYLVLILGCLEVAFRTREPFGRLVCVGVAALFAGQIMINAGMTLGLVPVTGVTLPFLSYGGSSLCTSFLALGLVLNVGLRRGVVFKEGPNLPARPLPARARRDVAVGYRPPPRSRARKPRRRTGRSHRTRLFPKRR